MRFTPHLMTQALKRGISPNDPRYAAFAEQTEAHEAAEDFKRRVRAITRGRTPLQHLDAGAASEKSREIEYPAQSLDIYELGTEQIWVINGEHKSPTAFRVVLNEGRPTHWQRVI